VVNPSSKTRTPEAVFFVLRHKLVHVGSSDLIDSYFNPFLAVHIIPRIHASLLLPGNPSGYVPDVYVNDTPWCCWYITARLSNDVAGKRLLDRPESCKTDQSPFKHLTLQRHEQVFPHIVLRDPIV